MHKLIKFIPRRELYNIAKHFNADICIFAWILIDGKLLVHLFGFKSVQFYDILFLEMSISVDKLLPQYKTLAQTEKERGLRGRDREKESVQSCIREVYSRKVVENSEDWGSYRSDGIDEVDLGSCSRLVSGGFHEKRLLNDLLDTYNVLERPVGNESEPLVLNFGLTLMQIIDVVSAQLFSSASSSGVGLIFP
ncbi:Acetylcholine receptor subunit alpha-type acr-16 [Atta colombica]|uniref:Acetylcholine receptor subunit alpha-type acr-16 n=1 Tax=Atta colombica TaxID=520822 RepID=A0A151I044_9HYME|nr:Acetylcholine receptor subunit alpha-type acr-16 [Atta colombica]